MTGDMSIEERTNGPLVVCGVRSMWGADLEPIPCQPVMHLCRCGQSQAKPFCDGAHARAGFQGRGGTPAGADRLIAYEGAKVTVTYNPMLCAHAAECGRLAPHVFDPAAKPWVRPDSGTVDEIRAVVSACPSGALALRGAGGEPVHLIAMRPQIQVQRNGPYWVHDIDPPAPQLANGASARKYALCRCGRSGNKPYCDGTHRDTGWTDEQ